MAFQFQFQFIFTYISYKQQYKENFGWGNQKEHSSKWMIFWDWRLLAWGRLMPPNVYRLY